MGDSPLQAAGTSKSAKPYPDCVELALTPRPFSRLVDRLCETTSIGRFTQRHRDTALQGPSRPESASGRKGRRKRAQAKQKAHAVQLLFEPLEPRLLLSADVIAVDLSNGPDAHQSHSLLIRQIEETETVGDQTVSVQRVQVVDQNSGAVLAFGDLSQIGSIAITTGSGADTLTVLLNSADDVLPAISFDGGEGEDHVIIEASSLGPQPFTWTVDGINSGTLTGPLSIAFSSVENLTGSDDTEDTFVITAGGHLDGILDGGDRGFDTLVLDGGTFAKVTYAASGPDSGTIDRDGAIITYAGLEPIVDNTIVADWVFNPGVGLLDGHDKAELRWAGAGYVNGPDYMVLESLDGHFETVFFRTPTGSITIDLGAGNDELIVGAFDPLFSGDLKVTGFVYGTGGDVFDANGNDITDHNDYDTVTFTQSISLNGGSIAIESERIVVGPNVTLDTRNRDGADATIGDSGDIGFKGHRIDIQSGSMLIASSGDNAFAGGLIEIAAERAPNPHVLSFVQTLSPLLIMSQRAVVNITDATIDGGEVVISANAETEPSWYDVPEYGDLRDGLIEGFIGSATGILAALPDLLLSQLSPVIGQVSIHKSYAEVNLTNAVVISQSTVEISASAQADSSFTVIAINNQIQVPFILAIGYGETLVSANVNIGGTSTITAPGSISIQSLTTSTTDVASRTMANSRMFDPPPDPNAPPPQDIEFGLSLAIAVSEVQSHVNLGAGSLVHSTGGNVLIEALAGDGDNDDAMSTSADSDAQLYKDGTGSATIAISVGKADVTVTIDGTVIAENPLAEEGVVEFDAAGAIGIQDDTIEITVDGASEFARGDRVVYRADGGTPIGGLIDGETYVIADVEEVSRDAAANTVTQRIKLARASTLDLDSSQVNDTAQHTLTLVELLKFLPAQVSQASNGDLAIDPVGDLVGLVSGEKLVYLGANSPVQADIDAAEFVPDAAGDRIVRTDGGPPFAALGLFVGQTITITGTQNNNGVHTIKSFSADGNTLFLEGANQLTAENADLMRLEAAAGDPLVGFVRFDLASAEFVRNAAGDSLIRTDGGPRFDSLGLTVGQTFTIDGTASNDNKTFTIKGFSADGNTLFLEEANEVVAESAVVLQLQTTPADLAVGQEYEIFVDVDGTIRLLNPANPTGHIAFDSAGAGVHGFARYSTLPAFNPVAAVDNDADVIRLDDHGLETGQLVIYAGDQSQVFTTDVFEFTGNLPPTVAGEASGLGPPIGGLSDSTAYFVVKVDDDHIRLSKTRPTALLGEVIDLTAAGTGTQSFEAPGSFKGIKIRTDMAAENWVSSTVYLQEGKQNSWWVYGTFSDPVSMLAGAKALLNVLQGVAEHTTETETEGTDTGIEIDLGVTIGINVFNHNLRTTIGSTAILKSGADIAIESGISQSVGATSVSKAAREDPQDAVISISFALGVYDNSAVVDVKSGATIDAARTISIDSSIEYPGNAPEDIAAGYIETLSESGLGGVDFILNDGNFGLAGLFNLHVSAIATGGDVSVGGAVGITVFENTAHAIVESGVAINQDPGYRSGEQSVSLSADTTLVQNEVGQNSLFNVSILGGVDAIRGANNFGEFLKALVNPTGVEGKTAIGPVVLVNVTTNSTIAEFRRTSALVIDLPQSGGGALSIPGHHSLKTGAPVRYERPDNIAEISGLANGQIYYAIVDASDRTKIRLAASYQDALAGNAIAIATTGLSGLQYTLTPETALPVDLANSGGGALALPVYHALQNGTAVRYEAQAGLPDIAGLTSGETYFVIRDAGDPNRISLAATYDDAVNGVAIPINSSGLVGAGYLLTPQTVVYTDAFASNGDVLGLNVSATQDLANVSVAQTGAKASDFGLTASVAVSVLVSETVAGIGGDIRIEGGGIDVLADDLVNRYTIAGTILVSEQAGVGISVGVNAIDRDVRGYIGTDSLAAGAGRTVDIETDEDVSAAAKAHGYVLSVVAGGSIQGNNPVSGQPPLEEGVKLGPVDKNSMPEIALVISAAVNVEDYNVRAYAGGASITAGGVSIAAESDTRTQAVAVAAAVVIDAPELSLESRNTSLQITGAGAVVVNDRNQTVEAFVADSMLIAGAGGVALNARDKSTLLVDAGGYAISISDESRGVQNGSTSVSVGFSVGVNDISGSVKSYVSGSVVRSEGPVEIRAQSEPLIDMTGIAGAIAGASSVGGGGSGSTNTVAGAASGSWNKIAIETSAAIVSGSDVDSDDEVVIEAIDNSIVQAEAVGGAIALTASGNDSRAFSIGAAVALNTIGNTVSAHVTDSEVAADGDVTIAAQSTAKITTVSFAGSVAVSIGFGGSSLGGALSGAISVNNLQNTISAYISSGSTVVTRNAASIDVRAVDSATVAATNGSVSISASVAASSYAVGVSIGVATAHNLIRNSVKAYIDGSSVSADGDVALLADAGAFIRAETFSAAGSVSVGSGGPAVTIGLTVAHADNDIANTIHAYIAGDARVVTGDGGAVSLTAEDGSEILAVNVAAALGLAVSVSGPAIAFNAAGAAATNRIENSIKAYVDDVGGGAAAAPNAIVESGGDILLSAASTSVIKATGVAVALSVSVGSVGVSIAFGVTVAKNEIVNTVHATIGDSKVVADGDIRIEADSGGTIVATSVAAAVSVSVSTGAAAVSGSGAVTHSTNLIDNDVLSAIQGAGSVTTTSGGNVSISATDNAKIEAVDVTAALSVSVSMQGVSGALAIAASKQTNTIQNTIRAAIFDTTAGGRDLTLDVAGSVRVSADSLSSITATGVGVSVSVAVTNPTQGVAVALAGAGVDIENKVTNTVAAIIRNAKVEADGDITVTAKDRNTITANLTTVSIAAAVGAAVSIAVSLNDNSISNAVSAEITSSAVTSAAGDISILADQGATINATGTVVSIAAGIGAAGGGGNVKSTVGGSVLSGILTNSVVEAAAGRVEVEALSDIFVDTKGQGGSGAVGLAVSEMLVESKVTTTVGASVGSAEVTAHDLDVKAEAVRRTAESRLALGSVGVVGAAGGKATSTISGDITSSIGNNAIIRITGGDVAVLADTKALAKAKAEGGAGGLIAVSVFEGEATVTGATKATIGDNVSFLLTNSGPGLNNLSVLATAHDVQAIVDNFVLSISGIGGGGTTAIAKVQTGVVAEIGDGILIEDATGLILVGSDAKDMRANASADGGAASFAAGGLGIKTEASVISDETNKALSRAGIGEGGSITAAGISVLADYKDFVSAETVVGAGAILGANATGRATATSNGGAEAWIGARKDAASNGAAGDYVAVAGDIVVKAFSDAYAKSRVLLGSGALLESGGSVDATSSVTSVTLAFVGGNSALTSQVGNISITAIGYAEGDAKAEGYGGAGVAAGYSAISSVTVTNNVDARVGGAATLLAPIGDIVIEATGGTNDAPATSRDATLKSVNGVGETIHFSPDISVSDGALVTFNDSEGEAILDAAGNALPGSPRLYRAATVIAAVGQVTINGDHIVRTDGADWRTYGFEIGDLVVVSYDPGDGTVKTQSVIIEDFVNSGTEMVLKAALGLTGVTTVMRLTTQATTRMRFGANFDAAQIDPASNIIEFESAHYFQNGDAVRYQAMSGSLVPGLAEGVTYYVRVLGTSSIQLMTSRAAALTPPVDVTLTDLGTMSASTQAAVDYDNGTIDRTDGLSWADAGFHVGDVISLSSANPLAPPELAGDYTIVAIEDDSGTESRLVLQLNGGPTGWDTIAAADRVSPLLLTIENQSRASGLIVTAHTFANGALVTYIAPSPIVTGSVFVDVTGVDPLTNLPQTNADGDIERSDTANTIYLAIPQYDPVTGDVTQAPHNFKNGDRVVYTVPDGPAIGGLTHGNPYFVKITAAHGAYLIQLSETLDGAAIELVPDLTDNGKAALHSFMRIGDEPLPGLVDGETYEVVNAPGGFTLKKLNGDPITNFLLDDLNADATHRFTLAAVNVSDVVGRGSIFLNLTGDAEITGNKVLRTPAGVSYGQLTTVGNDRLSYAESRVGVGALGAVGLPTSTVTYNSHVTAVLETRSTGHTAEIAAAAGGEFRMSATSIVNADSFARNDGGGAILVSDSRARTAIESHASVTIGNDVSVEARTIDIDALADNELKVESVGKGGGIGAYARTVGSSKLDAKAQVNVGERASMRALGDISINTDMTNVMREDVRAELWGASIPPFVPGLLFAYANDPNQPVTGFPMQLDFDGLSEIVIGADAHLDGRTVSLHANVEKLDIRQRNFARAIIVTLFGGLSALAYADASVNSTARVDIKGNGNDDSPGTIIAGWQGVDIIARQKNLSVERRAGRLGVAFVPIQEARARGSDTITTEVLAASGATVFASARDANGPLTGGLDNAALYVEADAPALPLLPVGSQKIGGAGYEGDGDTRLDAYFDGSSVTPSNTPPRTEWHADVVISAGRARLIVDVNGNIAEAINVTVDGTLNPAVGSAADSDGDGDIVIGDIFGAGASLGNIVFHTPKGTVSGGELAAAPPPKYWGTFSFLSGFQSVELINHSTHDLVVGNIHLTNGAPATAPKVDIVTAAAAGATITFDIAYDYPADILIRSTQDSDIILAGTGIPELDVNGQPTVSASIENPLGTTRIENLIGNILSPLDETIIRTNRLFVRADDGSIGTIDDRLRVELVGTDYRASTVSLTAGGDIYLDLMARMREATTSNNALTVDVALVAAGGNADIVLREGVRETGSGTVGGIQVRVTGGNYLPYNSFFRPPTADPTAPGTGVGIGSRGANPVAVDTTYNFGLIQAGEDGSERNITIVAQGIGSATPPARIIGIVGNTDIIGTGHIDVDTNGAVELIEVAGDMRLGLIRSRGGDVTLRSGGSIVDAPAGSPADPLTGDDESDVTGVNVTLVAAGGSIGSVANFIDVDTSNANGVTQIGLLGAGASGHIFIREVDGDTGAPDDMRIGTIFSLNGNVVLRTEDGAILDGSADETSNIIAIDIDLFTAANGEATYIGIGTAQDMLDINTGATSPAGTGRLVAIAEVTIDPDDPGAFVPDTGIYIRETSRELNVLTVASPNGSVVLLVPEGILGGSDLNLLASGTLYDGTPVASASITASDHILLEIGDDFTTRNNSVIEAGLTIVVRGDHGNADPQGTTMDIRGRFVAPQIAFYGHTGDDSFLFTETYLGGETFVYGSHTASPGFVEGLAPHANDGNDIFIVDRLQTMPGGPSSMLPPGANRPTLNLDGQSGSDQYIILAHGGAALLADYVINVVDTGAANSGVDTLVIEGSAGDDMFLLRRTVGTNEVDKAQGMVALPHGTIGESIANLDGRTQTVERINYSTAINGGLTIRGLDGDDVFVSDDNLTVTTLDGGDGDDLFQIGQLFGTPRLNPVDSPDAFEGIAKHNQFRTVLTTNGWLSAGASFEMTVLGGAGSDQFVVLSNEAPVLLSGGDDDDLFSVSAFRVVGQQLADALAGQPRHVVSAALAALDRNLLPHHVNDVVTIRGGAGIDELVVFGTGVDDGFLTDTVSVSGGGLDIVFNSPDTIRFTGRCDESIGLSPALVLPGETNPPPFDSCPKPTTLVFIPPPPDTTIRITISTPTPGTNDWQYPPRLTGIPGMGGATDLLLSSSGRKIGGGDPEGTPIGSIDELNRRGGDPDGLPVSIEELNRRGGGGVEACEHHHVTPCSENDASCARGSGERDACALGCSDAGNGQADHDRDCASQCGGECDCRLGCGTEGDSDDACIDDPERTGTSDCDPSDRSRKRKSDAGSSDLMALAFPFDILDQDIIRLIPLVPSAVPSEPDAHGDDAGEDGWVWVEELGGMVRFEDLERFGLEPSVSGPAEKPVINWQRQAVLVAQE